MPTLTSPILATPTLGDLAIITGGPVAGSLPLSNLQSEQPSQPTRWTDLTQIYAVFDLKSAYNINLLSLLYSNATSSATIRWRAATSIANLTSAPIYDSGAVPFWPTPDLGASGFTRFPSYLFSSTGFASARYWRVDVADPSNPRTYFQAGRAVIASTSSLPATCYQFPRGAAAGGTLGPREAIARLESAGGQIYPKVGAKRDAQKFSVVYEDQAGAIKVINAIKRTRGSSRSVLFILDPSDNTYIVEKSIYGLLTLDDTPYVGYVEGTGVCYTVSGLMEEMP